MYIINIVQRSALYGYAHKIYRFEDSNGGEFTRSPDLPNYIENLCGQLFRRKLISNLSAREFLGIAHIVLKRDIVQLYDHSVNKKIKA